MDKNLVITNALINEFLESGRFTVTTIEINSVNRCYWIRLKSDPEAFRKKMFDGSWSVVGQYPAIGSLRILRILTGNDGVTRAVARQGDFLYAYPFT